MATFDKVRDMLAEQLSIEPAKITAESEFVADLNADSLDLMEFMLALEDEFGITIPEDDDAMKSIKTVGDAVKLIESNN